MAKFKKGQSGNPAGKAKGTRDKRTAYRELLTPHAPQLVAKLVELALDGDPTALRIAIDRLLPPLRAHDEPVDGLALKGGITEQARRIVDALNDGTITPNQTAVLMGAIAAQGKIMETDELEKRVTALEQKPSTKGNTV